MQAALSILTPTGTDLSDFYTMSEVTWHDLGMDAICEKLTEKADERAIVRRIMMNLTKDRKTAAYRGAVFQDIIGNPALRERILKLLNQVDNLQEYMSLKRNIDKSDGVWSLMRRLKEVNDYILCVEELDACLSDASLHSEGLLTLREYIQKIQQDCAFAQLKTDIASLRLETNKVKSVTLGINLNENFEAASMGIVALNDRYFTKANVLSNFHQRIAKTEQNQEEADWNGSYAYHTASEEPILEGSGFEKKVRIFTAAMNPLMGVGIGLSRVTEHTPEENIMEHLDQVANRMLASTVRELKKVLAKYATVSIYSITGLIPEFLYYILWARYLEKLMGEGYTFCQASVLETHSSGERMNAQGVYNLKLASIAKTPPSEIVGNRLTFDKEHCIYILTGANRGGKTTITQAIGQLFVLAQGGISVPGTAFQFDPVDRIYTHFPADEDKTMDYGRLGEECHRFREIFSGCTKDSLLLLNETFSTTSFEEGYYIAYDALRAILSKGIRTIYNTHMHKLARELDKINETSPLVKAASLIVKAEKGKRSYQVEVAPAEGISYASDIARKYQVTYEQLLSDN
jgi:hypothetical protein